MNLSDAQRTRAYQHADEQSDFDASRGVFDQGGYASITQARHAARVERLAISSKWTSALLADNVSFTYRPHGNTPFRNDCLATPLKEA